MDTKQELRKLTSIFSETAQVLKNFFKFIFLCFNITKAKLLNQFR